MTMVNIFRENEKVIFGKTSEGGKYRYTVESDTTEHFPISSENFILAMKYYKSESKRLNASFI